MAPRGVRSDAFKFENMCREKHDYVQDRAKEKMDFRLGPVNYPCNRSNKLDNHG